MGPIFLQPIFKERIWGGTKLQEEFGYAIPSDQTGECWGVSAHPNGQSIVKSGPYQGLTLGELLEKERALFGNVDSETFPLLTKILDARTDLSVQVHPDDEYGKAYENGELGKTECWYVIDCEPGAEIIFGHHAKTKAQFVEMIESGQWDQLLRKVKVSPGDFFYVPSGTIHAIGAGVLILETQQSSDTTYRVYDFDRVEADGNRRELHIDKAIAVSTIPHEDHVTTPNVTDLPSATVVSFVEEQYFSVFKWEVRQSLTTNVKDKFLICSVIEGDGELKIGPSTSSIVKGDHFILPANLGEITIEGNVSLIVSHP
jgi:mannose-6-phosphate isomerase